jgi:hypothetical protein
MVMALTRDACRSALTTFWDFNYSTPFFALFFMSSPMLNLVLSSTVENLLAFRTAFE